jgi:hypothetical protein
MNVDKEYKSIISYIGNTRVIMSRKPEKDFNVDIEKSTNVKKIREGIGNISFL